MDSSSTRLRRPGMLVGLAAALLLVSSCTAGSADNVGTARAPAPPPEPGEQVTIEVWSKFSDRELGVLNGVLDDFHAEHPDIRIESKGNLNDSKIIQAVRGGNPPDVAISVSSENLGQFCSSGAWQDLEPYLRRDHVDLGRIPQAVRDYTRYRGTRCAMPMLADVYGLYYNTEAFAKAGITAPPRTTSELTEMTKRLTEWNPDGSIKVAGFLPVLGSQANHPWTWAPQWGATWVTGKGDSALGEDPAWEKMFRWQRELVEFYGWDRLVEFTAGLGQMYSADNAFHQGKVAMMIGGEFRTAFIADQAPGLPYDTAPFPVPDARPELYGGGYVTGTMIGIPRGAEHAGAAWELVRYLSTDVHAQVALSNGLNNVPSITTALDAPGLRHDERFRTFLDIFASSKLATSPPSPNGNAYMKSAQDFAVRWQSGQVRDLGAGLDRLDDQIDAAKALAGE